MGKHITLGMFLSLSLCNINVESSEEINTARKSDVFGFEADQSTQRATTVRGEVRMKVSTRTLMQEKSAEFYQL